ncbi:MAG: hypothetical protein KME42_15565 [Tildeniella nuda ZEHNDER 1965/U140]|nr:hypothetical protein [Tildeniella nuda ZEHNDER 1965/U140]
MLRSRQKPCTLCTQTAPMLYRIQHDASGVWAFVCPKCWTKTSQNNPNYVYGGTWKATKKD